jgi:hypothetical protein
MTASTNRQNITAASAVRADQHFLRLLECLFRPAGRGLASPERADG